MIKDEALKLALEALQLCTNAGMIPMYLNANQTAIAAIEEALAQPEQEPVALPCCGYADASAVKWNLHNQVVQCHNCGQVYETPPQRTWVGLTDETIRTNTRLSYVQESQRMTMGISFPKCSNSLKPNSRRRTHDTRSITHGAGGVKNTA
jgi:hypothetical protein